MQVPIKLYIQRQLTALLESTPEIDLTGVVFRGRNGMGRESTDPRGYAVNIIEAPRQDPGGYIARGEARNSDWELYIQAMFLPTIEANLAINDPTDELYIIGAAIEVRLARLIAKAPGGKPGGLYPEHYYFGLPDQKLVSKIEVGPSLVRPATGQDMAVLYQTLVIGLPQQAGKPYIEVD